MRAESKREGPLRPKHPNALLALLLALGSSGTMAQNLVQNGAFDTSFTGWFFSGVSFTTAMWVSQGAPSGAASGAVEIRHQAPGTGSPVGALSQCVNLSPGGNELAYAGMARTELEGEPQVIAWLRFLPFEGDDCTDYGGAERIAFILNTGSTNWTAGSGSFTLAPGVRSLSVDLAIEKPIGSGDNGAAYFDSIVLFHPDLVDIALRRWSIDAGGGRASNGGIVLSGSIGQPEPGSASGGGISLQSGFWFGSAGGAPPVGDLIFRNGFE